MKVLYIGHYRDGTGWGNAAVNNILAMDAAGIDVVPRAITYNKVDSSYPDKIKELELQDDSDCDVVIQHTIPTNYNYDSNYKNIGCFCVESDCMKSTGWVQHLNLMDEVWVPCRTNKIIAEKSGVTVPVKVVPYSIDISKYKETNGEKIKELNDNFTFGFVGEFIERKNLKALVKAFHIEFDPKERVNLFIKTSKTSLESAQKYLHHIKNGLKIRQHYREEVIVAGMMDEKNYISVLNQIDCFVMPSRGESFCIPGLECMALGKPSIYTEGTGMDYLVGHSVESYKTPCFGAVDTMSYIDTAESNWLEIDVIKLAKTMRQVYNDYDKETLSKKCKAAASTLSHQKVGNIIKEYLNDS
jgi:glycosyltransferase involved in cell wall biosynthesis